MRRRDFHCWACAVLGGSSPLLVSAQSTAGNIVRFVVPFAAGGGADAVARVVAQAFPKEAGNLVIDNKPGAGGTVAASYVTTSPPDGKTILLGSTATLVINPLLNSAVKYDPLKDLVPVAGLVSLPYLVVTRASSPHTSLTALLNSAAAEANAVSFGSPGIGTTNHLVGMMLQSRAKAKMVHVPYKGAAAAMNDVIGGRIDFMSGDLGTLLPAVKDGRLRPLGVTSATRMSVLPEVPAIAETLPGFEASAWIGIFVPKSTPKPVVDGLSAAFKSAVENPDVRQRFVAMGGAPISANTNLSALIRSDAEKWGRVISENQIKKDDVN